ncbi:branched-chain amino acid ABC transporter permease [Dactylosporangium sp. CA-139066]|uniref:branched-chain amino acid ABC transporter permease n=1 Tax=Dactylosporangium sp. CA-139066 TaxID=3239930 RepID=UPI003D906D5A
MSLFLQQLANGVALGSAYAIFAVGFGLLFANLGLLNVAMGSFATIGAVAGHWVVESWGVPWPVAIPAACLAGAVVGLVVDRVAFEPLRRRREASALSPIISSIAVWIILDGLVVLLTDAQPVYFRLDELPTGAVRLGSVTVAQIELLTIVLAALLTAGLYVFLHRNAFGMAIRAVSYRPRSAVLSGVRPQSVIIATTLVAGAMVGLSGALVGLTSNNITLGLGQGLFLKGFVAVIVGGYGDVRGAALGGLLIGVTEVLAAQYVSNSFRDVISMGLLIVILVLRPQGILGSREAIVRA